MVGYEEIYKVSNCGDIKSADRTVIQIDGKVRKFFGKNLKPSPSSEYLAVSLCKNGKQKTLRIHRIVAEAFLPNPENKPEVNHKDGNKFNNNINNLEWCSKLENNQHARKNNLIDSKKLRKPISQFSKDGIFLNTFDSQREAAIFTKICYRQINCCLKNKQPSAGGFVWKYNN